LSVIYADCFVKSLEVFLSLLCKKLLRLDQFINVALLVNGCIDESMGDRPSCYAGGMTIAWPLAKLQSIPSPNYAK
jgi:hypothetical protein